MADSALTRDLVGELGEIRARFGPEWARRKLELLGRAARCKLTPPTRLRGYHDHLLFLVAFPDTREVGRRAQEGLERIAAAAHAAVERGDRRWLDRLRDTGIAGTAVECAFSLDLVRWLIRKFPNDVDLVWEEGSASAELDEYRHAFVSHLEQDSMRAEELSVQQWFQLVTGDGEPSVLAWLVRQLVRLPVSGEIRDLVFNALNLRVRWALNQADNSRTLARFPPRPIHYQRQRPGRVSLRRALSAELPRPRLARRREAEHLIDIARTTLCVRHRETEATVHANPREVMLFNLERGIDVALYGLAPSRRLPVESFFGYVVARNRVPLGYGGGWVFYNRLEIGANVFDSYRGGDSAFVFAQILRVYWRYFGADHAFIDSVQFGWDNVEGLRSGAFWFYYRLGFRPADSSVAELAAGEWAKIRGGHGYRTPLRTLRRLTASSLVYRSDAAAGDAQAPPDLAELGLAVTRTAARDFDGDREAMDRWARTRVGRVLPVGNTHSWTTDERLAFQRLSPLVALIPDLTHWPERDKRALVALMRAKGGPRESDYAHKLRRHARFRRALAALSGETENRDRGTVPSTNN